MKRNYKKLARSRTTKKGKSDFVSQGPSSGRGADLWVPKDELKPLPPRKEWGSKNSFEHYKTLMSGEKRIRCQEFSKTRLREGYKGVDAQCPQSAQPGTLYCASHNRNRKKPKKKDPVSLKQEFTRYRKYLGVHLLKRVIDIADDPNRLSLAEELDLVTARLSQILEKLDTGESGQAWKMVVDAEAQLRVGLKSNDATMIVDAAKTLSRAIGMSDYRTWEEAIHIIQHRKTLAESERRRAVEAAEIITVTEIMGILAHIEESLLNLFPAGDPYRHKIHSIFMPLAAPDPSLLPKGDSPKDMVLIQNSKVEDPEGCEICRNEGLRERNYDNNGLFVCPKCGAAWSKR